MVNVIIKWDSLHDYRREMQNRIPADYQPDQLYELMEYYLINASEDGYSHKEKQLYLQLAEGFSRILKQAFALSSLITDHIRIKDDI